MRNFVPSPSRFASELGRTGVSEEFWKSMLPGVHVPGYPGSTIKNKIDDRIRNGGHVGCYTVPVCCLVK